MIWFIISGHTEEVYPVVISIDSVLELKAMELNDEGLLIGAAVTIAELEDRLKTIIPTLPGICVRFNQYLLFYICRVKK